MENHDCLEPKSVSIPAPVLALLKLYGPQIKTLVKQAASNAIDVLFAQLGVE